MAQAGGHRSSLWTFNKASFPSSAAPFQAGEGWHPLNLQGWRPKEVGYFPEVGNVAGGGGRRREAAAGSGEQTGRGMCDQLLIPREAQEPAEAEGARRNLISG